MKWKVRVGKLKKFIILLLIISFLGAPVLALELDTSIDDDIRRNYNPSKIDQDNPLPALPKVLIEPDYVAPKQIVVSKAQAKSIPSSLKTPKETYIVLKKGTKIKVRLQSAISDRTKKGTQIAFVSEYPVTTTYFTIPMGTVFKGEIVNSHKPQLSGNGGLVVVKIKSAVINDSIQPINAKVTKANSKKIFLNNIKGKRKYVSSMLKSTRPGRHFFRKMLGVTRNLAFDGSSIILTPFSLAAGVVALGGNVLVSPALAMFYKGSSLSIPADSRFEIKLVEDVFIYN